MSNYFKSEDIKVFPSAYREASKDPEARAFTEKNLINSGSILNFLSGGEEGKAKNYIISYEYEENEETKENKLTKLSCVVGGYRFDIKNIDKYTFMNTSSKEGRWFVVSTKSVTIGKDITTQILDEAGGSGSTTDCVLDQSDNFVGLEVITSYPDPKNSYAGILQVLSEGNICKSSLIPTIYQNAEGKTEVENTLVLPKGLETTNPVTIDIKKDDKHSIVGSFEIKNDTQKIIKVENSDSTTKVYKDLKLFATGYEDTSYGPVIQYNSSTSIAVPTLSIFARKQQGSYSYEPDTSPVLSIAKGGTIYTGAKTYLYPLDSDASGYKITANHYIQVDPGSITGITGASYTERKTDTLNPTSDDDAWIAIGSGNSITVTLKHTLDSQSSKKYKTDEEFTINGTGTECIKFSWKISGDAYHGQQTGTFSYVVGNKTTGTEETGASYTTDSGYGASCEIKITGSVYKDVNNSATCLEGNEKITNPAITIQHGSSSNSKITIKTDGTATATSETDIGTENTQYKVEGSTSFKDPVYTAGGLRASNIECDGSITASTKVSTPYLYLSGRLYAGSTTSASYAASSNIVAAANRHLWQVSVCFKCKEIGTTGTTYYVELPPIIMTTNTDNSPSNIAVIDYLKNNYTTGSPLSYGLHNCNLSWYDSASSYYRNVTAYNFERSTREITFSTMWMGTENLKAIVNFTTADSGNCYVTAVKVY